MDPGENVRNVHVQLLDHRVAEPVVGLIVEFCHERQELLDVIVIEEVYARHDLAVDSLVVLHKLFYYKLKFLSEKSFECVQEYRLVDVHLYVARDNHVPTLFIQPHTLVLGENFLLGLRWVLVLFGWGKALIGANGEV